MHYPTRQAGTVIKAHALVDEKTSDIECLRREKEAVENFLGTHEKASFQIFSTRLDDFSSKHTRLELSRLDPFQTAVITHMEALRAAAEAHLERMDAYIEELIQQRQRLTEQLQRNAHESSLIHRIPFDVLGTIFSMCTIDPELSKPESYSWYSRKKDLLFPMKLASVSVAWRQAALRTPLVWSRIKVCVLDKDLRSSGYSDSRGILNISFAREWIKRSGITPLHLHLSWSCKGQEGAEWAALLASLSHRIVTYEVGGSSDYQSPRDALSGLSSLDFPILLANPFPILEEFTFLKFGDMQSSTEALRAPRLRHARLGTPLGGAPLTDLGSLQSLSFQDGCLFQARRLWLTQSGAHLSLRSLTLSPDVAIQTIANTVVELMALTELKVSNIHNSFYQHLLATFSMPALESLCIGDLAKETYRWSDGFNGKGGFSNFLEKAAEAPIAFPALQNLEVTSVLGADAALKKFVKAHAGTLKNIRLIRVTASQTLAALSKPPPVRGNQAGYCHTLDTLEVEECGRRGSGSYEEMLRTRWTDAIPLPESDDPSVSAMPSGAYSRLVSLKWDCKTLVPPTPPSGGVVDSKKEA